MKYILFLFLSVSLSAFSAQNPKGVFAGAYTYCPPEKVYSVAVNQSGSVYYRNQHNFSRHAASSKSQSKDIYLVLLLEALKRKSSVIIHLPGKQDCTDRFVPPPDYLELF